MIKRRLWLFDIEGTLTGSGGRGFDYLLPKRLTQMMKMGSMVGLCSGRELAYGRTAHTLFNLNGPVMGESGCSWWSPTMGEFHRGERLHGLSSEVRQKIRQAVMEANLGETAWEDWRKEAVSTWYLRGFPHQSQEEVDALYEAISGATKLMKEITVTRSSAAVDITPAGIDKGSGVIELCDKMEVPLSVVSYVGDSWNDWPAFEKTLVGGGRGIFVGDNAALAIQLQQLGGEVVSQGSRGLARWLLDEI